MLTYGGASHVDGEVVLHHDLFILHFGQYRHCSVFDENAEQLRCLCRRQAVVTD
jgi:hypothetical protein